MKNTNCHALIQDEGGPKLESQQPTNQQTHVIQVLLFSPKRHFDTNEQKIESSGGKVHVDLHYNFQATLFNRLTLKMRTLVKYWHVYA